MDGLNQTVGDKLDLNYENFCSFLNQNKSFNQYFGNAIKLGFETNLFDLFDTYLISCLKNDNKFESNIQLTRILSLCSQFNNFCSESGLQPID